MAQEDVTLRLRIDAKTAELKRTQAELAALAAQAEATDDRFEALSNNTAKFDDRLKNSGQRLKNTTQGLKEYSAASGKLNKQLADTNRAHSFFTRNLNSNGKAMRRTSRFMRGPFRLAIKLAAVEMLGMLAALSSVNGALAVGRALSRAWSSTVNALGVAAANAAAGIAAAIALFTAAQRQFSAAQGSGNYGGDFAASSRALRTVRADSQLAVFGVQGLSSAFSAASQNARVTGQTVAGMRGLTDFAVMSGDMEKGITAAATLVSLLQSGKNAQGEQVLSAAADLGPQFEEAFKNVLKTGKTTNEELLKMFASGELAEAAGVSGTATNVQGTLMGQLRTFATEFQNLFADIGQSFIRPVQETFQRLNVIFRRTMAEISGNLYGFATGGFIDAIVWAAEKLSDFIVVLFNKYLPYTDQFIDNFTKKWRALSDWFSDGLERFRKGLRRFSDASKQVNTFLGTIFRSIGRGLRDNFVQLADWVVENADKFQRFGQTAGDLFYEIIRFTGRLRTAIFEAEPAISILVSGFVNVASALVTVVELFSKFISLLGSISGTGPLGALGALTGLFGAMALLSGLRGKGGGLGLRGLRGMGAIGMLGGAYGLGSAGAYQLFGSLQNENPMSAQSIGARTLRNASSAALLAPALFYGGTNILGNIAGARAARSLGPLSGNMAKQVAIGKMRAGVNMPGMMAAIALAAGGMTLTDTGVQAITRNKDLTNQRIAGIRTSEVLGYGAGIGGGAATGAATAAILAQFVPVLGQIAALPVALIGGLIGAVAGGVTTFVRSRQAKKDAKKAGTEFADVYFDGLEEMLRAGGLEEAKDAFTNFNEALDKFANSQGYSDLVKEEGLKQGLERMEPALKNIKVMAANLADLSAASGMSNNEVFALAQSLEIDLTSNVMTLQELLAATGIAVQRFGDDFNNAFNSIMAESISQIDMALGILQAPAVINEAARSFREMALSGESTPQDFANFLRTAGEQTLMLAGGDPVQAFANLLTGIGTSDAFGSQFTTPGGVLFGLQDYVSPEILDAFIGTQRMGLQQLVAENVIQEIAGRGFQMSTAMAEDLVGAFTDEQLIAAAQAAQRGESLFGPEYVGTRFMTPEETALGAKSQLEQTIEEMTGIQLELQRSQAEIERDLMRDAIVEGLETGLSTLEEAINTFNANIDALVIAAGGDPDAMDTFSPRRNLVDTMSKHGQFDMMIGGKRSITSAYRTNMLGSGMSDHAAGRAYDLTGQNLGMYQSLVRANGGYADFHGFGGNRHLHVVPGNAPMGDTAVPRMMPAMVSGGSSSGGGDSITVNVYPSEGMDEQALASRVIERLDRINRDRNERR